MIYLGFGLLLGLIVLAMEDAATTAFGKTLPLLLALGAPAVGLAFRQSIFGRISGRFVALTPGGIVVGTRGRPRTVTWEEFERLGERRGVPVLYLHESGVQVPLDDIFRDSQELGEFRAALKAAAKSAKQRSGM